ncbi:MAG: M15 family metallopeptidase, partial [Actinomycetota bacterium]|nr:M15 family metallopeptidase [Actinomycetota bacterium]
PVGRASGATIGTMTFRILKNGFIDPDPAWVAANIATATVPILGTVHCHRITIPQLTAALSEIADAGLASEIRPEEYAGCYVPRFIDRDPRRGLSMHAFGLAVDLNTRTNQFGTRGDMHPDVVAIFERWGFAWGGYWANPDPMHFELARIVRP